MSTVSKGKVYILITALLFLCVYKRNLRVKINRMILSAAVILLSVVWNIVAGAKKEGMGIETA